VPFPNTVASFSPDFGETMAETRTRVSCQTDCAALDPSVNLRYEDIWTDPVVRAPDASFEYLYSGLSTPLPTSLGCTTTWTSNCRIVINYELHVHPLWSLPRTDAMLNDVTCSQGGCHAPTDAMAATAVPQAQLDLTDGLSIDQQDHFNAYRELLFTTVEQELVAGQLQTVQVQIGTDANGNQLFVDSTVAPPMRSAGANASSDFFSVFDAGGTHAGYLSPDELRLLAEWLDVGAQYYNNPFEVPVN
jgi:hypothetical protein